MSEHKILSLLQRKRGFFEAILDITEMEDSLPLSEWVSMLEQKRVLLKCIDEIDRELLPYKDSLNAISQEISEELSDLQKIVKKILEIDSVNVFKRKKELQTPYD